MTIFSVLVVIIGYTLFGDAEYMHKHFKDFMEGYYTTYVMLTQDGWVDKFEDGWTNFRNGGSDGNFLIWLIFFLAMVSMDQHRSFYPKINFDHSTVLQMLTLSFRSSFSVSLLEQSSLLQLLQTWIMS